MGVLISDDYERPLTRDGIIARIHVERKHSKERAAAVPALESISRPTNLLKRLARLLRLI